MEWYAIDTWIVVVGVLAAVACALPGNFLVLQRMSLMGDAISHAVLPGLAIAFMVTQARSSMAMFVGAAVAGLLTALLTEWISRLGKVDQGASMGIVFTSFFAVGLLLIVQAADHVDLDPGCVLYGAIELTPLDVVWEAELAGQILEIPRAVVVLGLVLVVNAGFILLFFKELRLASFDPEMARAQGIPVAALYNGLMALVAMTTVAVFEVVGSIIVIAMLIVPSSTAYLLMKRLRGMIVLSGVLASASAFLGHLGALFLPDWMGFAGTSTSGMMAVAAGLLFLLALLFSPLDGLLLRCFRARAGKGM
ncbi:MAG: metal ABC transporter permease [Coraliomargaritaceae bacterium]